MRSMVEGAHAASAEELKDAVLGVDEQSPLPPPAPPEHVRGRHFPRKRGRNRASHNSRDVSSEPPRTSGRRTPGAARRLSRAGSAADQAPSARRDRRRPVLRAHRRSSRPPRPAAPAPREAGPTPPSSPDYDARRRRQAIHAADSGNDAGPRQLKRRSFRSRWRRHRRRPPPAARRPGKAGTHLFREHERFIGESRLSRDTSC